MSALFGSVIATFVISLISLIGGFFFLQKESLSKRLVSYFVSFAAGVMLSATFLDILPKAVEEGSAEDVFIFCLIGMVVSFFMERFVLFYHHHHEETHDIHPSAYLVIFGDGIHNLIDGIAITAAFFTNPLLGIMTTIAIAAHEIPQEIADFSILLHAGLSRAQALVYNFLSALTALFGVFIGVYFLQTSAHTIPLALGFTGGMFIYISSADLIPELHREYNKQKTGIQTLIFLMGILLIYILTSVVAH